MKAGVYVLTPKLRDGVGSGPSVMSSGIALVVIAFLFHLSPNFLASEI